MARRRLMTKTEYAKYVGVDKAQPGRWIKKGMPTAGPNGDMIDPDVADTWRASNIDSSKPKAKGHEVRRLTSPPPEAKAAALAPRPPRHDPPPDLHPDLAPVDPGGTSLEGAVITFPDGTAVDVKSLPNINAINQLDRFYAAEMKRREIMVHDREHLPKADVFAATDALISMFRARVMGLGRRCAPLLDGKSAAERAEIIQDECRTLLEDVSKKLAAAAAGDGVDAERADPELEAAAVEAEDA